MDNSSLKVEEEIKEVAEHYMKVCSIPGVALAYLQGGEISCIKCFGYANKKKKKALEKDTYFQVASISKTVTAWGVMKLVERGEIDLDAPVEKYLTRWKFPPSKFSSEEVTIRRILSHTAGLSVSAYTGYKVNKKLPSLEKSLALGVGSYDSLRIVQEPGTQLLYSGGGYSLLQMLIEEVTGMDFDQYMKNEILIPLGMKNSTFRWGMEVSDKIASPYGFWGNMKPNYVFVEKAAAGLYTTVQDMAIFLSACVSCDNEKFDEQRVLKSKTLSLMYKRTIRVFPGGLGCFLTTLPNGIKLAYHTASNIGWYAGYSINIKDGNGVVILTNSDSGRFLVKEVMKLWTENEKKSKLEPDISKDNCKENCSNIKLNKKSKSRIHYFYDAISFIITRRIYYFVKLWVCHKIRLKKC